MENLTKNESEAVEQAAESSFGQPTMKDSFQDWATRTISDAKKEEKKEKKSAGPREVKLEGRSPDEREWIEKVAQKDEPKESAKESRRENSTEKEAAGRNEQRPDAKAGEKSAASEPLSGDRHWQAAEGKVVLDEKETNDHWSHVNSRVGVALEYMNQHPQKSEMENGFRAIFAGKPPAWGQAVMRDLTSALAEVASPGEVLRHITLQAQDREVIRSAKNWKELRAAIQTVAKHYPGLASQASPKPRAPKPPSEVGGRGAVADDGTRGETDFGNFSARMSQRYR